MSGPKVAFCLKASATYCFLAVIQLWQQHGLRRSIDTDIILTVTNQSARKKHRAASKVEVYSFLQTKAPLLQYTESNPLMQIHG